MLLKESAHKPERAQPVASAETSGYSGDLCRNDKKQQGLMKRRIRTMNFITLCDDSVTSIMIIMVLLILKALDSRSAN